MHPTEGLLRGFRVVEIADQQGEYAGLLLAGLGAEVIKIEPPEGSPTRRIGPFYPGHDDIEHSLHFWHYNRGKRSISLDLESPDGQAQLTELLRHSDVLLETVSPQHPTLMSESPADLGKHLPWLVHARITPFGEKGPWAARKGSDLVHLALGGVMMNCGYDPDPAGQYDLPPVAPQAWHAYHIAGEQVVIGVLAALIHRERTGSGQQVFLNVHQAVSANTELDTMFWVMRHVTLHRRTCRHASEGLDGVPTIGMTKDGRWMMCFLRGLRDEEILRSFLERYDAYPADFGETSDGLGPDSHVPGSEAMLESTARMTELGHRFINRFTYDGVPWREAQEAGVLLVPLRKPHENLDDEHWRQRGTYGEVDHPEIGRTLRYPVSKWVSNRTAWQVGRRAPILDEDAADIRRSASGAVVTSVRRSDLGQHSPIPSPCPPFALDGVRILDFGWFLATAGGTRFLAALGAECIKVEWRSNPDSRNAAMAPVGGRAARDKATGPLEGVKDPNMGGQFNNKNPGKYGLSLNVRHPKGLEIAKELVALCDVVTEGFSPGVMERWGLGYAALRSIRPDIIYVQQSGFGTLGQYGRYRTFGPTAASITGLSEMSGLPEPAMPAGWGYSYLDWIGAYTFAQAILAALLYRERTGEGQWIDASQCESGLHLSGPTLLEWQTRGTVYRRTGNSSPYLAAAPHGVYRTAGDDRWLAIACFTEDEWRGLAEVATRPEWLTDDRFTDLRRRLANRVELDALISAWCKDLDGPATAERLQAAGVAAGMCQTAEDKCDRDPQLSTLGWLCELDGTKIGRWPVVDVPIHLSATPAHVGGRIDRAAPIYGEDTAALLTRLLGLSEDEISKLEEEGVI